MKNVVKIISAIVIVLVLSLILTTNCQTSTGSKSPKNIILMIADGWGINQIIATDYYEFGETGNVQAYQKFPVQYFMSHYSALSSNPKSNPLGKKGSYAPEKAWKSFDYFKQRPTDSAASATALSTGVKTYNGSICIDLNGNPLETIVETAEKNGKATGVVTSVQMSHATPAGMAAHNEKRSNYADIAKEMIYKSGMEVIMGAGHPYYNGDGGKKASADYEYKYVGGETSWKDLTAGTAGNDADGDGVFDNWTLIQDKEEFKTLTTGDTQKRIIGIPKVALTLQKNRSGKTIEKDISSEPYTDALIQTVPTLETMVEGALNVLDNDKDGFFLMVEGGAVDWTGHGNTAPRLIEEMIDFNNSVEAVVRWVEQNSSWDETLVIITGDHETGYLTGPGSGTINGSPEWTKPANNGKGVLPTTEWHSTGHTNQLIPLFAKGAGSELFKEYADEVDSVRGSYTDNAEVGQLMKRVINMNP
ncbi:alkaline phosphatase [bacterium]|nr:alkaline phosphatase [bacterium]